MANTQALGQARDVVRAPALMQLILVLQDDRLMGVKALASDTLEK